MCRSIFTCVHCMKTLACITYLISALQNLLVTGKGISRCFSDSFCLRQTNNVRKCRNCWKASRSHSLQYTAVVINSILALLYYTNLKLFPSTIATTISVIYFLVAIFRFLFLSVCLSNFHSEKLSSKNHSPNLILIL